MRFFKYYLHWNRIIAQIIQCIYLNEKNNHHFPMHKMSNIKLSIAMFSYRKKAKKQDTIIIMNI